MNFISLKLVTPEKTVLEQELVSLTCPTNLGQITILPGHTTLVATLVPGELHAKTSDSEFFIFVSGGFVQVSPVRSRTPLGSADALKHQTSNGANPHIQEVVILADSAEHHHEIDQKRAEEARARAQKTLTEQKLSNEEYAKVAASLEKSLGRIHVARKHSHRKNPLTGEGVFKQ